MNTSQSRRDFLLTTCASCLLGTMGITLTSCDSQDPGDDGNGGGGGGGGGTVNGVTVNGNTITIDLNHPSNAVLKAAGGGLVIARASTIVANDGGTINAFSWTCTHQGGQLTVFQNGDFVCNNHGSHFNTAGVPVSGDAFNLGTGPVPAYTASRSGDTVTIVK